MQPRPAQVNSFGELLALRIGFAAAQATQNPVCFSLIPELFPRERSTAMAAYNAAIYMGRALSFAAVILADQLGIPTGDIGVTMVRLQITHSYGLCRVTLHLPTAGPTC